MKWSRRISALLIACMLCGIGMTSWAGAVSYEEYLPQVTGFEETEKQSGLSILVTSVIRVDRSNTMDTPRGVASFIAFGDVPERAFDGNGHSYTTASMLGTALSEFVTSYGPLVDQAEVGDQVTLKVWEVVVNWDMTQEQHFGGILAQRDSGCRVVINVEEEIPVPDGLAASKKEGSRPWTADLGSGYDKGSYVLQIGDGKQLYWVANVFNVNQTLEFKSSAFDGFTGDLTGNDVTLRKVQHDHISSDGKTVYLNVSQTSQPQEETVVDPATGGNPSAWAESGVNEARNQGLIPAGLDGNYQSDITRAEFCHLAAAWLESVAGQPLDTLLNEAGVEPVLFNDTGDEVISAMSALGVVNGIGGGQFNPDASITREEAAVMLWRLGRQTGDLKPNAVWFSFVDQAQISTWAQEAVATISACETDGNRIMNGTGNDQFSPKETYTREQSILTLLRLKQYLAG